MQITANAAQRRIAIAAGAGNMDVELPHAERAGDGVCGGSVAPGFAKSAAPSTPAIGARLGGARG